MQENASRLLGASATEGNVLYPSVTIVCAGALFNLVLYVFGDHVQSQSYVEFAPLVMILVTLLTCSINGILMFRRSHEFLWSPLPWFLVASSVYYGVGPLVYYLGNPESVEYVDAFYTVDRPLLLMIVALNSTGILIICATWRAMLPFANLSRFVSPKPMRPDQLKKLACFFLLLGGGVKYFLILPYEFGLTSFILPGSIIACGNFTHLATFVLIYLIASGQAGSSIKIFTVLYLIAELAVQVLSFSKQNTLQVLVMVFLGAFTARPNLKILLWFTLLIVVTYFVYAPLVTWGREEVGRGGYDKPGLADRLEIAQAYFTRGIAERRDQQSPIQLGWVRLSQVNYQGFAIDSYDRGAPGGTLSFAIYALIPRIIWADKPIITFGDQFNYAATGSTDNATGPGLWGEAYWNGGWPTVILTCFYVGVVLAVFTQVIVPSIRVRDFRVLPVAFFGLLMGGRPDDWFAATYVNCIPICVIYTLGIYRLF